MSSSPKKPRPPLPPGPYLVVGLARSGAAIARVLAGRGEEVVGVDSGDPPQAAGLEGEGVEIHTDADGTDLLARAGAVIKSPGVPREAPVIATARHRGVPVVGELEVAWRLLPNRLVGITGTNGKTTVAELCGHLWRAAGERVAVAGNVGTPLADHVGSLDPEATVICECSSFQLEDAEAFAPECAVLLNFSPDHLDRHGTLEDYLAAKLRIFSNQTPDDVAIHPEMTEIGADVPGDARRIDLGDVELPVDVDELRLVGEHNADNARAAAAAALAMGIAPVAVADGLRSFVGVPHRLERIAQIDGVLYVNDSKATNVAAALAALGSFPGRPIRLILGGVAKGDDLADLAGPIAPTCAAAYLIGEAADRLERDLAAVTEAGVELRRSGDLPRAVADASAAAKPGEVVLLAPACASFDAYRDFEQRGEHFRALVEGLG